MEKTKKGNGHKIAMTALASIILTVLIVSLVNVGLSIFLESPDYSDFCGIKGPQKAETEAECVAAGGDWNAYEFRDPVLPEESARGYCDFDAECREEHDEAQQSYNQVRYYVFAVLGLALLLVGGYAYLPSVQYTGMASGGILLLEGIVTNFENKSLVFVSLIIILAIFSWIVYKKVEKK